MFWFWIFFWWLSGAASFLWLRRGEWTWATIAGAITIWGFVGPIVWIIIVVIIIAQLDFWNKPVFPEKEDNK